ncbi:MAG: efflux RND transporter periplasmic adaptor subunit [Cytophagia bacterium]|nr:efflux RND transporter periplasmic adaptor subunit [Cytophagia bacterium]NVK84337.1 efflux RND transporter periplasmic adaptor subunit [Cytophagia bacterium]
MAKKKKGSNRIIWILLIAIAAILILAVVGKQAGLIGGASTIQVEMAQVGKKTIVEKVTASGVVQPVTEIIISPDVAGEIIELNVEEGDFVNEGMILVKIRPDNLISALDRAKANLNQQMANLASSKASKARSEAQLTQAELAYKRAEELKKENVISDADYETARSNYLTAKYNLEAAEESVKAAEYIIKSSEATVEEAEENVRFTIIRAPASGTISLLNVEKGERVVGTQQMAGTEMMRIADLNQMQVEVDVNENDIIRVNQGDTAIIDVDSYSQMETKFKGVVTQIANTANSKSSADAVTEFKVEIRILNESFNELLSEINGPSPFRPGMTASVEIITTTKDNVLSVPLAAVTTRNPKLDGRVAGTGEGGPQGASVSSANDDNLKEVVFINDNGTAKMVEVKTGISDFDNIEIVSGLEEGQEVISGPFFVVSKRLKNGDLVEKTAKPAPGAAPAQTN